MRIAKIIGLFLVVALLTRLDHLTSIPFLLILIDRLWNKSPRLQLTRADYAIFALTGLILYPTALGFTSFDPYSLGWGKLLPFAIFLIAVASVWKQKHLALLLAAALVAAVLRMYPSENLWDYLIDPIFFFYSVTQLFRRKNRNQSLPDSTAQAPSLP